MSLEPKRQGTRPQHYSFNCESGMTLVEVALVVILIGVLSTLAVNRIEYMVLAKQQGEIRRLLNTWEMLFNEALARGEAYRLIIDLDKGSYFVRREIKAQEGVVKEVDYIANLRTKGEKERRKNRAEENLLSLEEEFAKEDARQGLDLETLFYLSLFADPEGNMRLARPLEFPSLAKEKLLDEGISIRDIKTEGGTIKAGKASIRFSPRGSSEFAVIHFLINEEHVVTALLNPWTGVSKVQEGDVDFEWTLNKR